MHEEQKPPPATLNESTKQVKSEKPFRSPFEDAFNKKPSKWRFFYIALGILQVLGIGLLVFIMFSIAGQTGSEFIALALLMTYVPAMGIIALLNLIGLPIYMYRNRPRRAWLVLSILSLLVSVAIVGFGAFNIYQLMMASRYNVNQFATKSAEHEKQFSSDNVKPEITKEEAIELLKSCQIKSFYYTSQAETENHGNTQIPAAETTTTGVVLVKVDGKPYRIHIADRLIPELVPIARESQKVCGGPQFWHDGYYEQQRDGKWYFKNEVVNNISSELTEDEAINLMQGCKVDYFVGYTNQVETIKDANTRSWLKKAEQASRGLAVLEGPPHTYVFASKGMTADLQDKARQFRASCYKQKKLYITIDNWIETEYPVGTWKKVEQ